MDASFWIRRWTKNEISFHLSEANPLMIAHFAALNMEAGSRIFLPLCGKTLDITWLLAKGYRVAGAELSEMAIEQLFESLGIQPTITAVGQLVHYSAQGIDIYVGDIFALSAEILGEVDAVYDRAALVALPEALRQQYTAHLIHLTHRAPQLLICYEYDQGVMSGPPFSVNDEEVKQHYAAPYHISLLDSVAVEGGLRGQCDAVEDVWLLQP